MNSEKFSHGSIIVIIACIAASIVIARILNPFDATFARVMFSAALGAIGGLTGVTLASLLGFRK